MKTIGIITIHKINNYGSVLQAYALQKVCEDIGYKVEIIDYKFPNTYHVQHKYQVISDAQLNEPIGIKILYSFALMRQHKEIKRFVLQYHNLSKSKYNSPDELALTPPIYDIYITGSDQLWNPRHCGGDPSFLLHFAPEKARKVSYAASICAEKLPDELVEMYKNLLSRYSEISVRENNGVPVIYNLIGKRPTVVLDPTLLLDYNQWNNIAVKERLINKKYILCYFLNYTFNAFPFVDDLAEYVRKQTGYEIVRVARPPHKICFCHTRYEVGASPEEFLALVRDSEMVLTTSFHGTAFAVNYGKPLFTVVQDKFSSDNRQVSLMHNLGLEKQVLSVNDTMPEIRLSDYDFDEEQTALAKLRRQSFEYLKTALSND